MALDIMPEKILGTPTNHSSKIGFISLGCPKALVDSERILTELRKDGYEIVPTYQDADVVVVNTCGFIDSAKKESLDTIGEALSENGKVIVAGCMGANAEGITKLRILSWLKSLMHTSTIFGQKVLKA
jgi:ribosomal protein S12 methylthiotransferase